MKQRPMFSFALAVIASLLRIGEPAAAQLDLQAIPTGTPVSVGACKFKMANMFGGKLIIPRYGPTPPSQGLYYLPDTGPKASSVIRGFALFCVDANAKEIGTQLDARQVDGEWLVYNPWPNPNFPEYSPFDQGAHPRTVQFNGRNWTGLGLTVDDTTGDEKKAAPAHSFSA